MPIHAMMSILELAELGKQSLTDRTRATVVLMPVEPTPEIIEALYGPYLSEAAHESRLRAYHAALIAAQNATAAHANARSG